MGIEWAEISYLRGQQSVCVCVAYAYVCVCTLSGVSIYSRGDLDKSGQTHKHTHTKPKVLPDDRWCILWLSYSYPSASHETKCVVFVVVDDNDDPSVCCGTWLLFLARSLANLCGDISEFVDISAAHAPINQPSSTKIQRVWQRPRVKTNNKTNTRKSHIC